MKHIFFFLLLLPGLAFGQEVVSETAEYLTYQDSLFVLKTTTITNQGVEGLNDTTVTYSEPVDSNGVVSYVGNIALNDVLSRSGAMRQAFKYRRILSTFAAYDAVLDNVIGADLYEYAANEFRGDYLGTWRIIGDSINTVVELTDHPTLPGLMRLTEATGPGAWNVRILTRDLFLVLNFEGQSVYLNATDQNNLFAELPFFFPPAMGGDATGVRAVKLD